MPDPILEVTDLEGDYNQFINPGLLEAPEISDAIETQFIYLPNGWSMFSFWVNLMEIAYWDTNNYPNGITMAGIMKQFLYKPNPNGEDTLVYSNASDWNRLLIVKNNSGNAYLPAYDFDGISGANPQAGQDNFEQYGVAGQFQGWQIKISTGGPSYYIKISGPRHAPATTSTDNFPVVNGWNMIGIPYKDTAVNAVVFSESFVDNVIIIKDYMGAAYLPEWNFNGIGDLEAGQGYQLKMTNHTSSNTVSGTVEIVWNDDDMGPPIDDPVDDTPITDDNVNIIDDTPIIADTNMTIKVPSPIISGFLPDLGISHILDEKKRLINVYYDGGKAVNPDGGREVLAVEQALNQNNLIKTYKEENIEVEKEKINIFQQAFNTISNKYPPINDPSGYSTELETLINNYWNLISNKNISYYNETGTQLLRKFLSGINFRFSFFSFEPTNDNLVGRVEFNFRNMREIKNILIPCQGDDLTTTEDEGLVVGEVPRVFFFSGEKYYNCNFNVSAGDLSFIDKKIIDISSVTFDFPVLKPV